MQENVGTIDRWVRVALGAGLVTAGLSRLTRRTAAPTALVGLGALVLESALTRVCPLNALLGVDTRRLDRGSSPREPSALTARLRLAAEQSSASVLRTPAGARGREPG
jgi:hypothetical protein